MEKTEVEMLFAYECKNSHRYDLAAAKGALQSVYINKSAFQGKPPARVRISIEAVG